MNDKEKSIYDNEIFWDTIYAHIAISTNINIKLNPLYNLL